MINLFKKRSRIEVLQKKYDKLMKQCYDLTNVSQTMSNQKLTQAESLLKEMAHIRLKQ